MRWADEERGYFLGCRKAFICKPTDGKSSQHQIMMCCLMGNFLIPLTKVVFSGIRSGGASVTQSPSDRLYCDRVFLQIVSFWQPLCFHKLLFLSVYLHGDFFFVGVRSGEHLTEFRSVKFKCARLCSSGKTQSCCLLEMQAIPPASIHNLV